MQSLSDADVREYIRSHNYVVLLLDAPWNGTGQALKRRLEMATDHFGDQVGIAYVNTDESQQLSTELKLTNVPTLAFYRNGRLEQLLGGVSHNVVAEIGLLLSGEAIQFMQADDAPPPFIPPTEEQTSHGIASFIRWLRGI